VPGPGGNQLHGSPVLPSTNWVNTARLGWGNGGVGVRASGEAAGWPGPGYQAGPAPWSKEFECKQRPFLLRSFLTLYKVTVGSTGLPKNDTGAESEGGSMAGTFCSCGHGSMRHQQATSLPCHPLLLLALVQRPSEHRCRTGI